VLPVVPVYAATGPEEEIIIQRLFAEMKTGNEKVTHFKTTIFSSCVKYSQTPMLRYCLFTAVCVGISKAPVN
jgi:hypothetical protein